MAIGLSGSKGGISKMALGISGSKGGINQKTINNSFEYVLTFKKLIENARTKNNKLLIEPKSF